MKINLMSEGCVIFFNLCINLFVVWDDNLDLFCVFGENVFFWIEFDDKFGLLIDDRKFLDIMDKGFYKIEEGNWLVLFLFCDWDIKIFNNKL